MRTTTFDMLKDKRFFITGASGQLAKEFASVLDRENIPFRSSSHRDLDISDVAAVEKVLDLAQPNVLLNCAAYNRVDDAEDDREGALKVNHVAVANLAKICKARGILLVHFSSDYVFDGKKKSLYTEIDQPAPMSVYGLSKWLGEQAVEECGGDYLIFRLSWVFGDGQVNFLYKLTEWAKQSDVIKVVCDETAVPTYTVDAVPVVLKAVEQNLRGMFHLSNDGYCSRFELAEYYYRQLGIKKDVVPVSSAIFQLKAKRPEFSPLSSQKIRSALSITIPDWQDAVSRFIKTQEKN